MLRAAIYELKIFSLSIQSTGVIVYIRPTLSAICRDVEVAFAASYVRLYHRCRKSERSASGLSTIALGLIFIVDRRDALLLALTASVAEENIPSALCE